MKDKILQYIQTTLLGDQQSVSCSQDLLTSGLIDSIGVMRLLTFIEVEIGKVVPPQDVTLENFSDINSIVHYLESRPS